MKCLMVLASLKKLAAYIPGGSSPILFFASSFFNFFASAFFFFFSFSAFLIFFAWSIFSILCAVYMMNRTGGMEDARICNAIKKYSCREVVLFKYHRKTIELAATQDYVFNSSFTNQ